MALQTVVNKDQLNTFLHFTRDNHYFYGRSLLPWVAFSKTQPTSQNKNENLTLALGNLKGQKLKKKKEDII